MLPPLPRCSRWAYSSLKIAHPYQPSPIPLSGRPAHRHFRGLLGVYSRCGLHTRAVTKFVTVIRGLQTFRLLHACPGCFRLERSPGGACTHWKAPPCHGARGKRSFDLRQETVLRRQRKEDGLRRRPSVVGVFGTVSQLAAQESVGTGLRKANGQGAPARAKSAAAAICASNRAPRSGSSIPSAASK